MLTAVLAAAGRCRQLQRCFEVLDLMTNSGIPSDEITFTCLIEAAVLVGEVDIAQRVFARAMAAGITSSVQVSSCVITLQYHIASLMLLLTMLHA